MTPPHTPPHRAGLQVDSLVSVACRGRIVEKQKSKSREQQQRNETTQKGIREEEKLSPAKIVPRAQAQRGVFLGNGY